MRILARIGRLGARRVRFSLRDRAEFWRYLHQQRVSERRAADPFAEGAGRSARRRAGERAVACHDGRSADLHDHAPSGRRNRFRDRRRTAAGPIRRSRRDRHDADARRWNSKCSSSATAPHGPGSTRRPRAAVRPRKSKPSLLTDRARQAPTDGRPAAGCRPCRRSSPVGLRFTLTMAFVRTNLRERGRPARGSDHEERSPGQLQRRL